LSDLTALAVCDNSLPLPRLQSLLRFWGPDLTKVPPRPHIRCPASGIPLRHWLSSGRMITRVVESGHLHSHFEAEAGQSWKNLTMDLSLCESSLGLEADWCEEDPNGQLVSWPWLSFPGQATLWLLWHAGIFHNSSLALSVARYPKRLLSRTVANT
jgi:hypothetical protein